MEKQRFIRLLFLFAAALFFSGCDKEESDYPYYFSFATIEVPAESPNDYFFTLDSGLTAFPVDKSRVNYLSSGKDGGRAVIYFNFVAQPDTGFDSHIALYEVMDIQSKEVETAVDNVDIIILGDDPIGVEEARISGGWLDIYYYYPSDGTGTSKHRLSLVDNKTAMPPTDMPEGYTYLEFRQNAGGDTYGHGIIKNYISFRLGDWDPAVSGSKGIYLRVANPGSATTYLQIEPQQKKE